MPSFCISWPANWSCDTNAVGNDKLTCCQLAPLPLPPFSLPLPVPLPIAIHFRHSVATRLHVDDDDNAPGITFDPTPMTCERQPPLPAPLYDLQLSACGAPLDTPPSLPPARPECQHQRRLRATPRRRIECHLMSMDFIFMRTNQRILCPDNFRLRRNSQKHTPGKLT